MRVHSLTLSYIHGNMRCDSRASLLARTLASLYFGYEPKAKVATFVLSYFDARKGPDVFCKLA